VVFVFGGFEKAGGIVSSLVWALLLLLYLLVWVVVFLLKLLTLG